MTDLEIELIVADASALVLVVASGGAAADALAERLARASLAAPVHVGVEVDSALRGLERGAKLTSAQTASARRAFAALPIDLWDWTLIADRAWQLRENLTTYDAGYVALAERLGAVLVTADARIARAPGLRCTVEVTAAG